MGSSDALCLTQKPPVYAGTAQLAGNYVSKLPWMLTQGKAELDTLLVLHPEGLTVLASAGTAASGCPARHGWAVRQSGSVCAYEGRVCVGASLFSTLRAR